MMVAGEERARTLGTRGFFVGLMTIAVAIAVICPVAFGSPSQAYADSLEAGSTLDTQAANYTIVKVTGNMKKAYNRAVAACKDYPNQPNPIVVDMSDLGLTEKQALQVGDMLHGNSELFFVNTYNDSSYGTKQFTLPCYYDDDQIAAKQKQLDSVAAKALKRIGPKMDAAMKVHMLHDFVIDHIVYTAGKKDAYTGLVDRQGDCFAYALSMDYLLRKAGFTTDMVFNPILDHAWNQVKIGSYWYNVDTTFDATLSYKRNLDRDTFDLTNQKCHFYLLQSDKMMARPYLDRYGYGFSSHAGWTAHQKCTDDYYYKRTIRGVNGQFSKECNEYKSIVRSFKVGGLKYTAITGNIVKVSSVTGKKQKAAKAITVPLTVKYKNVKYYVVGIGSKALKGTKAKILKVASTKLTADNVVNSLKGSKVTTVKLKGKATKKLAAYQEYFVKANSGKQVKVKK